MAVSMPIPDYKRQKLEIQPLLAQKLKPGDERLVFILSIIIYIKVDLLISSSMKSRVIFVASITYI